MKKPAKAPPPPEKVVRGSGSLRPSEIFRVRPKEPDWQFWRTLGKIQQWQACALSVGIDPDTLKPEAVPGNRMELTFDPMRFPSDDVAITFVKRGRLLAAHRGDSRFFSQPAVISPNPDTDEVLLSEVAAWAKGIGWEGMPEELLALAPEPADNLPPRDLILFNEVCDLLHGRLGSTAPELAMWIFQGDIPAWRRDGRAFQFSEAEKPGKAETAAQMLMAMEVRLSRKDVGAFQPDERYLEYPDVLAKIRAKFTDSYSATLGNELAREHWEITPKIERNGEPTLTPIGGRPMIAAVVPGGGYARQIQDGLFFQSEIEKFIASRDLVRHRRTPPAAPTIAIPTSEPLAPTPIDDAALTKRERQIRAIESEAKVLNFDCSHIPTGGKKTLLAACKKAHPDLFGAGSDPFNEAWKAARKFIPPRLQMKEHKKYTSK